MQGLVLSAYPRLNRARYLLFRIESVPGTRQWLAGHLRNNTITRAFRKHRFTDVADGDEVGTSLPNVNVAFTATGLALLSGALQRGQCLDVEALTTALPGFSYPFIEGIAAGKHRPRVIGAVGDSVPANWRWGAPQNNRIDILVCVFAAGGAADLNAAVAAIMPPTATMTEVGNLLPTLPQPAGDTREHFGFPDGISQPILAGSTDSERFPDTQHLTAVGEIVCGYSDAVGITTPAPRLGACSDFGHNGSYLVFCQFHQNVAAFRRQMLHAADNDPAVADAIASKIVGRRRQDGTPLVPYTTPTDNEFTFAEDPYGYGCPIGAHIRRANPRDAFLNDNVPLLPAIVRNRHRILRRGRSYGERLPEDVTTDDAQPRGLYFLCLNADIERQFEFILQNWVNNLALCGLRDESDPLIGGAESTADCPFTIPTLPAPSRIIAAERFVVIQGGQYFFLPGFRGLEHLARTT
jgi:Dyp-type peroxidase family